MISDRASLRSVAFSKLAEIAAGQPGQRIGQAFGADHRQVCLKLGDLFLGGEQNVKGQNIAARYGGEEFGVILPNTVLRAALTVADHVRRAVMSKELMKRSTGQNLGRVTISLGVATLRKDDTAQSLIARADACLYAAKRNGRNRVICEADPECARSESKVA